MSISWNVLLNSPAEAPLYQQAYFFSVGEKFHKKSPMKEWECQLPPSVSRLIKTSPYIRQVPHCMSRPIYCDGKGTLMISSYSEEKPQLIEACEGQGAFPEYLIFMSKYYLFVEQILKKQLSALILSHFALLILAEKSNKTFPVYFITLVIWERHRLIGLLKFDIQMLANSWLKELKEKSIFLGQDLFEFPLEKGRNVTTHQIERIPS